MSDLIIPNLKKRLWTFLVKEGIEMDFSEDRLLDSRAIDRAVEGCVDAFEKLESERTQTKEDKK